MAEPSDTIFTGNITNLDRARSRLRPSDNEIGGGGGGGGGGPTDDMERRVDALDKSFAKLDVKLDGIAKAIADGRLENEKRFGTIDVKLTAIEKTIDTRASLSDLNLLRGRVEGLPTTIQLLGFAVAVFVAAGISRWFLH